MFEEKFTHWVKWRNRFELNGLNYPGVYALAYSNNNIAGNHFSWMQEICYFGMSNSTKGLKGRLSQFDSTIRTKAKERHGGADRFNYKYKDYDKLTDHLYVSVSVFECDVTSFLPDDLNKMGDVAKFEYSCLAHYVDEYKHLPEFNDKKKSPKKDKKSR
ncbi:hypothetical protein BMS3Abin15_01177 [bacterium BMS3Abin15]|nr:hypothetical protein BMS3Abin15_01177 [bacterium BMS3Abin15]